MSINLWCHLSCKSIPWRIKNNCPYFTNLCTTRNISPKIIQSVLFTNPRTFPLYLKRLGRIVIRKPRSPLGEIWLCLCDDFLPQSYLGPKSHSLKCKLWGKVSQRKEKKKKERGSIWADKNSSHILITLKSLFASVCMFIMSIHICCGCVLFFYVQMVLKLICKRTLFGLKASTYKGWLF